MTTSSQNIDSIQLASHISDMSYFEPKSDSINIYITYEHEVYINNERMLYWDNLVPRIMNIDREHNIGNIFLSDIIITCDRRIKYRFLDKLKQEVGRTLKKYFFYRTQINGKESYLVEKNHGSLKDKWSIEPIRRRNNERDSVRMIESKQPPWMNSDEKPYNEELKQHFTKYLYHGDLSKIDSALNRHDSTFITLLPDKKYAFDGEIKELSEMHVLNQYISQGYIIFVRFDVEINFEDYISFLSEKRTRIAVSPENFNTSGLFVEIPFELEKKLKEWNLELF